MMTFEELMSRIHAKFGTAPSMPLVIKFNDGDGDMITMVKQEDFDIALFDFSVTELYLFDDPTVKLKW